MTNFNPNIQIIFKGNMAKGATWIYFEVTIILRIIK